MTSTVRSQYAKESALLRCAAAAALLLLLSGPRALPAVAGEKLERGKQLYQEKKYAEAETALQGAAQEEQRNPEAPLFLGLARLELQKFEPAINDFRKALELSGAADRAQVGLARAYIGLKDWDKAQQALTEAQKANAGNAQVYYYRGQIAVARKDYAAAVGEFEKCAELDPSHAYCHYYGGLAYNQLKKPDKMVKHFEAFLSQAPDAPEAPKVRALLRSIR
jgi:tetratricopeptide (TPR) repeat protein